MESSMKPLPGFAATVALAALSASLLAMSGCAGPAYSELYGTRYYRTPIDTYPVLVVSVDGQDYLTQPVRVDPGRHKVSVQAPPGGAQRFGDVRTIDLDVKACTRYWLVAVKENKLSQDFSIKVDYEEPMSGCRPPA
jgi:hypothetical protein